MRFAIPATGLLLLVAACGGGDSPFDVEEPTPTALGASQAPVSTNTAAPSGCAPGEYVVKDGDLLGAIAFDHHVTVEQIVQANQLPDADTLVIGQKLMIPCAQPTPIPSAAPSAT